MSKILSIDSRVSTQPVSIVKQAGIVICASAVIAVCARVMLPLPFTPVPLTLANFGVLLVGLALGSRRGFAAAALISGLGCDGTAGVCVGRSGKRGSAAGSHRRISLGLPGSRVFGRLDRGARDVPSFTRNLWRSVTAEVVLFVAGISWLAVMTHSWRQAAFFGLYPFLFAEVSKVMVAAAAAVRLRGSL